MDSFNEPAVMEDSAALPQRPSNHSTRTAEVLPGRLLTLTTKGIARWLDTDAPVSKAASIRVEEVVPLRGAAAVVVTGFTVNNNGQPGRSSKTREVMVSEGSFIVWW